jgi:hypothetical protein
MTTAVCVMEDRVSGTFLQESQADIYAGAPATDGVTATGAGIASALRELIGEERFDLWFERKSRLQMSGNTLVLEVGNAFAARWIEGKFRGTFWRRPAK